MISRISSSNPLNVTTTESTESGKSKSAMVESEALTPEAPEVKGEVKTATKGKLIAESRLQGDARAAELLSRVATRSSEEVVQDPTRVSESPAKPKEAGLLNQNTDNGGGA